MIRLKRNMLYLAFTSLLANLSAQEIQWLFSARQHISLLEARRTILIVSRARIVAAAFTLLTPLWFLIDIAVFPSQIWMPLLLARIATTVAFAAITLLASRMNTMTDAYRVLIMLFLVPASFYLFAHQHLAQFPLNPTQQEFSNTYTFLPFVMVAGLSLFPLTRNEFIAFISPIFLLQITSGFMLQPTGEWPAFYSSLWLMVLLASVAGMAGLSQIAFIIIIVRDAIHDHMTNCFSRQSGEKLLELQFVNSLRNNTPLAVAFVDIDHFKQVNDLFGHECGDTVLINTAAAIQRELRLGDMFIRWGGEEFLIILPNAAVAMAWNALQRVRLAGLGLRPDGAPVTASIGIAERIHDGLNDWRVLVETADARMYQAKQDGRDRIVGPGKESAYG